MQQVLDAGIFKSLNFSDKCYAVAIEGIQVFLEETISAYKTTVDELLTRNKIMDLYPERAIAYNSTGSTESTEFYSFLRKRDYSEFFKTISSYVSEQPACSKFIKQQI